MGLVGLDIGAAERPEIIQHEINGWIRGGPAWGERCLITHNATPKRQVSFQEDLVLALITSTTDPVFGSILLTGEAGPSEPYSRRSRICRISSSTLWETGVLIRCLLVAVPLNIYVGRAMPV